MWKGLQALLLHEGGAILAKGVAQESKDPVGQVLTTIAWNYIAKLLFQMLSNFVFILISLLLHFLQNLNL